MCRLACLFVFIVCLSACSVFSPTEVLATQDSITVMTWNIGTWHSHSLSLTSTERTTRMRRLADVIYSEKAEVVYLQEFNGVMPDLEALTARLRELSYEMHSDIVSYEAEKQNQQLLILSRYPLDESSKKITFSIRKGSRSAQSIIARDTPIGSVRLSNLHTHVLDACSNLESYIRFFYQFDKNISLLGGDTNALLATNGCADRITPEIYKDISITCEDAQSCKKEGIDWFFLPQQSTLVIKRMWSIGNRGGISDQHPAVVAQVGSTVSQKKPGDVDKNGVINIYDYNLILGAFDTNNCTLNLVGTCTVDIFDYNQVLSFFGS